MLLNYNYKIYFILLAILFSLISNLVHLVLYQKIYLFDINSRSNLNNVIFDLLSSVWTNINYLYTLLPLILILFFYYLFLRSYNTIYLLLYIAFIYITFDVSYSMCQSLSSILISNHLSNYNLLLINSLNKYHPILLYAILLGIILYVSLTNFSLKYNTGLRLNYYIFIILFTLSLGSWWAYQEGSWGGWWNWDPSEMFGLLIMSLVLFSRHAHLIKINVFNSIILSFNIGIVLLVFYSFLQLNFDLISHNFGLRDQTIVDIRVLYTIIILLLHLFLFYMLKYNSYPFTFYVNTYKNFIVFSIWVLTISLFFFAISALLNDLIWKTYNINIVNINIEYKTILLIIILLVTKNYSSNNIYLIFTCTLLFFALNNVIFLYFMFYRLTFNNFFNVVHRVIMLAFIQYILIEQNFSRWNSLSYNLFDYIYYNSTIDVSTYLGCTKQTSWPFISESFTFWFKNKLYDTSNNFIYTSTSLEFKTFITKSNLNISTQNLISDSTLWIFNNSVLSTETLVLLLTLYLVYTLLVYNTLNNIKVKI